MKIRNGAPGWRSFELPVSNILEISLYAPRAPTGALYSCLPLRYHFFIETINTRSKIMNVDQAEKDLLDAILAGDVARLDELLSDDLILTSQTGEVLTKTADLDAHRSGSLKILRAIPSELKILPTKNGSIVNVRMSLHCTYNSQHFSGDFRYTRVWEIQNGKWIVVACHITAIGSA